jgi:hypothetical protein
MEKRTRKNPNFMFNIACFVQAANSKTGASLCFEKENGLPAFVPSVSRTLKYGNAKNLLI